MTIKEVPLEKISCELFSNASTGSTAIDCDEPLLVIEEEDRFFLVDGFKRYFALKERGLRVPGSSSRPGRKRKRKSSASSAITQRAGPRCVRN